MPEMVNVKNTRKSLIELPYGTRLLPGENPVAAKRWEQEKGNPNTERLLRAGTLEVLDRPARPLQTEATEAERARAKTRGVTSLAEFDMEQVRTVVGDTDDLQLLEAWLEDDRGEVQKLVKARIRAVRKKS